MGLEPGLPGALPTRPCGAPRHGAWWKVRGAGGVEELDLAGRGDGGGVGGGSEEVPLLPRLQGEGGQEDYVSQALSTFAPVKNGTFARKITHLPREFLHICSKNGTFAL